MDLLKMYSLLKMEIFQCHVSSLENISLKPPFLHRLEKNKNTETTNLRTKKYPELSPLRRRLEGDDMKWLMEFLVESSLCSGPWKNELEVGWKNDPQWNPIFIFRPFIGITYNLIYDDRRGPPCSLSLYTHVCRLKEAEKILSGTFVLAIKWIFSN